MFGAIQLLSTSGLLVVQVISFLVEEKTPEIPLQYVEISEEENSTCKNLAEIVSLRLVCKDWNECIVNSLDFWYEFMIKNLEIAMLARGNEKIDFVKICDKNYVLCMQKLYLALKTIENLTFFSPMVSYSTYVHNPAILNESNDELVSDMIRLISPIIFIEKMDVIRGGYLTSEFSINFTLTNLQGTSKLTKLLFTISRCDYVGGTLREISITMKQNTIQLHHTNIHYDRNDKKRVTTSDLSLIKKAMDKIGLPNEMIDSQACVNEFLYTLYNKGFEKVYDIATCERDLFEIDEIQ